MFISNKVIKQQKTNKQNCRCLTSGFSYIEIMVAIIIIGTAFLGIVQAFPFALRINKTAENDTTATFLAQEKLEEINQLDYSEIAVGAYEAKHRLGATSTPLYYFQRQSDVVFVDGSIQDSVTDLGLKKITTTVFYTESVGKTERTYTITTLIADR